VSKKEAAMAVSPGDKMIRAWNAFSEDTKQLSYFLWSKKDSDGVRVYPEFTSVQYCKNLSKFRKNNLFGL
jgi:hypothetical protein